MIISNWALHEEHGTYHIKGEVIDNPPHKDGTAIRTGAIQFSEGNTIQTTSGSTYFLGKPEDVPMSSVPVHTINLKVLQSKLPTVPLNQPGFKAVIEDWQPTQTASGLPAFTGKSYGHTDIPDGETITTSAATDISYRNIVTGNSVYALGTPDVSVPKGVKENLINMVAAAAFDNNFAHS